MRAKRGCAREAADAPDAPEEIPPSSVTSIPCGVSTLSAASRETLETPPGARDTVSLRAARPSSRLSRPDDAGVPVVARREEGDGEKEKEEEEAARETAEEGAAEGVRPFKPCISGTSSEESADRRQAQQPRRRSTAMSRGGVIA
jgi:hypothetical protein